MAYETRQKKKSGFTTDDAITDASTFDYVKAGINKKATFATIKQLISDEYSLSGPTIEVQTATAGQTLFTLTTTQYVPGTNNLKIYINGVYQEPSEYIESSSTTVIFPAGSIQLNDSVAFVVGERLLLTDAVLGTNVQITVDGKLTNVNTYLNTQRVTDYTQLRNIDTSPLSDGSIVTVTDDGIAGDFVIRNSVSHGLTDNGGTIIVIDVNWYAERVIEDNNYHSVWFGATGDGVACSDEIQACIDSIPQASLTTETRNLILPRGKVKLDKPLWFYQKDGVTVKGHGKHATVVYVDAALTISMPANFTAINGAYKGYTYNATQAAFIVAARRVTQTTAGGGFSAGNGAAWLLSFEDFSFRAESTAFQTVSVFYAPEWAHSSHKNIYSNGAEYYYLGSDCYRFTFQDIDVQNGDRSFSIESGTTIHLNNVGVASCVYGFDIAAQYSTMTCCAVDSWGDGSSAAYAYKLAGGGWSLNGCGCEAGLGGIFDIGYDGLFNTTITINGGLYKGGAFPGDSNYTGQTGLSDFGVATRGMCSARYAEVTLNSTSIKTLYSPDGVSVAKFSFNLLMSHVTVNNMGTGTDGVGATPKLRYITAHDFFAFDDTDGTVVSAPSHFDKIAFRASLASDTVYSPSGSGQTIIFDTEEYDTYGDYNVSNGFFTTPVSSWYQIDGLVNVKQASPTRWAWVGIVGADNNYIFESPDDVSGDIVSFGLRVYLKRNQNIRIQIRTDNALDSATVTNASYFSITQC